MAAFGRLDKEASCCTAFPTHRDAMHKVLTDYFRCPDIPGDFSVPGGLSEKPGYFSLGPEIVCYGRASGGVAPTPTPSNGHLHDVFGNAQLNGSLNQLPFDPAEVIDNLRYERYVSPNGKGYKGRIRRVIREAYYAARPLLPMGVRKHLQRVHLKGWQRLSFPKWPIDTTVDILLEKLLALSIRSAQMKSIPFIWFWPEGANACSIMTHDVETEKGVAFSSSLMAIDREFGIPASFQIVPEERYHVSQEYLDSIRQRGFEVNIQDLNHDGHLFKDYKIFEKRVARINEYATQFNAAGFRSAVLYRNQAWYDLLEFAYDMSVPNVAHLDPQRGGCCTVMPYFVGKILELPVTMTQDYSLFYILKDYSLALWKQQVEVILQKHGLINVIVHPDYLDGNRATKVYKELLSFLAELRRNQNVWVTLPGEVNRWWRERNKMELVCQNGCWQVEGPGSERARVAFASLEGDRLTYTIQQRSETDNSGGRGTYPKRQECYPRNEI